MSDIDSHHDHVKKKTARNDGFLTLSEAQRKFADFIAENGGYAPEHSKIIPDEKWRRVKTRDDKRGETAGSYKMFADGRGGVFKDHRGEAKIWQADTGAAKLSHAERRAWRKEQSKQSAAAKRKQAAAYDAAAVTAEQAWNAATPAPATHAYLKKKRVQPHDIRVGTDGRLVIPVYDKSGRLRSVQYISAVASCSTPAARPAAAIS